MCGRLHQGFVIGICAVGPVVTSQVVPQILNGIELRRIGWQLHERDIGGNLQCFGRVEACLVPDHHGVHTRSELLCELGEELIDDMGVQVGSEQSNALSTLRTDAREHVKVVVLRLPHRPGTRAGFGPHAGQRALLSEARFVLEPNLHALLGMVRADGLDLCHDVFLKAS